MRSYVKSKKHRQHVKDMTLSEQINTPEGLWTTSKSTITEKVFKNVLEGARGKNGRKRKSKASKE